jgi:hypothetical protein
MKPPNQLLIEGSVSKRFEPVRQAFIENFTRRGELGGACCIYQDGEKVVDLWGGVRDRAKLASAVARRGRGAGEDPRSVGTEKLADPIVGHGHVVVTAHLA